VTDTINEPNPSPLPSTDVDREGPALPRPRPRRRSSKRLWLVFAVLLAAFVFLLVEGLGSSLNFFDTVDQALAHRATLGTRDFNLEGDVVAGSIHPTAVGTDFTIAEGGNKVAVASTGNPPQLFQVRIAVVVIGHFTSSRSRDFVSHQILVKHSENYCAANPKRVKSKSGNVVLC
jgi:cytochrome c-type biogenesis protein CcmE